MAKQELQIPSSQTDVSSPKDGEGLDCTNNAMSSSWFRFFNQLIGYIVAPKGAIFYQGAAAPAGWTAVTLTGITPPAGWIIIQRS